MTDPSALPLPTFTATEETMEKSKYLGERAKRVYAVGRWAGVIAVMEMRDGYDAAMAVVNAGPQQFYPTDEEWEKINTSGRIAINYVEGNETP